MPSPYNILIIHGPNLNMLGKREVSVYGKLTLDDINTSILNKAQQLSSTSTFQVQIFQSNAEHELIEKTHNSFQKVDYIIINPAAFTHTSVALRDALLAVNIPFIEVHLSNVHTREPFRHHSFFSDKADAVICGCGHLGYLYALDFAANKLTT